MEVGNEEEQLFGGEESGSEYSSDDSDNDRTYNILEETHSKLSKLSIKNNKAKARINEASDLADDADSDGRDVVFLPELDEIHEKCFEQVLRIIRAGQIEELKVDQCKIYLRKNGLRLTGNKATLIHRSRKHLEIVNGGGEKKYPVYSFELNCTRKDAHDFSCCYSFPFCPRHDKKRSIFQCSVLLQAQSSGSCVNNEKVTTKFGLEKTTIQDKYINQASHKITKIERTSPDIHEVQRRTNWAHLNLRGPKLSNIKRISPNIYDVQHRSSQTTEGA